MTPATSCADGNFEYARRYGEEVAAAGGEGDRATRSRWTLAPFAVSPEPIAVPVQNALYRAGTGRWA